MGCYPLFACADWSQLHHDLQALGTDLVSLSLVTDPFGAFDVDYLRGCFDIVTCFKQHFVFDLQQPIERCVAPYHRKYARRALRTLAVEKCDEPVQFIDQWVTLYDTLIKRHQITGLRAFSRSAFEKQMSIPGTVMFTASFQGTPVGGHLWYVQGDVAYSHLSAYSPLGYELRASYALQWFSLSYFADQVRWVNQGAGIKADGADGLSQYKRGWSTGTRTAYFCGRVLDREQYAAISRTKGTCGTGYFPAYRAGEFEV
jgi:hypothetical protein